MCGALEFWSFCSGYGYGSSPVLNWTNVGAFRVGCSFVRGAAGTAMAMAMTSVQGSYCQPGLARQHVSVVVSFSDFLHFMRVCLVFNLAEICFKTLCLSGGHLIILGKGMGNQSVSRIFQISDCLHVMRMSYVQIGWKLFQKLVSQWWPPNYSGQWNW